MFLLISVGRRVGCHGQRGEDVLPQGRKLLVTAQLGGLQGGEDPGERFHGDVLQQLGVQVNAVKREGVALFPRFDQVGLL